MRNLLILAAATMPLAAPAIAAERHYSVTSFDRIRIDGGYRVTLATGVAPFATASGNQAALDGVTIDVQGRTLIVHADRAAWDVTPTEGRGPLTITLGTHDLTAAWVNGAGSLTIDRVRGLGFDLALQGAGAASIGDVAIDQFRLAMAGSGIVRLAGTVHRLTAIVRGSSTLEASALATKDAVIGAEGPSTVRVGVSNSAKVDAAGLAAVSLVGAPACTIKLSGSATVEGCK